MEGGRRGLYAIQKAAELHGARVHGIDNDGIYTDVQVTAPTSVMNRFVRELGFSVR